VPLPTGAKPKRRIQPNVALPMLNWVPLRKITDTIFEELDDERILAELDFNEVSNLLPCMALPSCRALCVLQPEALTWACVAAV
jgi:hypothetical protein